MLVMGGKGDTIATDSGRWCILRTSGARTLPLVKSLCEAGIDAWSPAKVDRIRIPRTKRYAERRTAILPTFAFAREEHIGALRLALAQPISPHPLFWIFRHMERIPLISDREIEGLRAEEERAKRRELKSKRHEFPIGTTVKTSEAGFRGLSGVVERGDDRFALVCFGGRLRVKIATFLLESDGVEGGEQTGNGPAALAA